MGVTGRVVGAAAIVAGTIGTAVLGGMAAQRRAIQRYRALGEIAGTSVEGGRSGPPADRHYSVAASGGVALHVEEIGPEDAELTVVLAHGWTLQLAAWRLQCAALAASASPRVRIIRYDQRSHGASSRAPAGPVTLEDLAEDLAAVIATAAPAGPLVLVGHSMGGMAIMALARRDPGLFETRVRGVALISTSAAETHRGLGRLVQINGSNPVLPWAMRLAGRYPAIVERGRSAGHDAVWLATRAFGFADPSVPGDLVEFLDSMVSATPIDVIAEFAPALFDHDETDALPVLAHIPVLVAVGAQDRMTPPDRSRAIAAALPRAELLVVPEAGHMLPLERATEVNEAVLRLLSRAQGIDK